MTAFINLPEFEKRYLVKLLIEQLRYCQRGVASIENRDFDSIATLAVKIHKEYWEQYLQDSKHETRCRDEVKALVDEVGSVEKVEQLLEQAEVLEKYQR